MRKFVASCWYITGPAIVAAFCATSCRGGDVVGPGPGPSPGTVPAGPSSLVATTLSGGRIDISWRDNSSNESDFRVERADVGGGFSEIAIVSANVTVYQDTAVLGAASYAYRVRAHNASGFSGYTNEAVGTTPPRTATFLASVDNVLLYNSGDPNAQYTVYRSGYVQVGCLYFDGPGIPLPGYACFFGALKFSDMAELNGRTILRATFRLFPEQLPPERRTLYEVAAFAGDWNTATITFANAPLVYTADQPQAPPPSTTAASVDFDVTSIVQRWAGGSWPNYGLAARDANIAMPGYITSRVTGFASSDTYSAAGRRPQIDVEYK